MSRKIIALIALCGLIISLAAVFAHAAMVVAPRPDSWVTWNRATVVANGKIYVFGGTSYSSYDARESHYGECKLLSHTEPCLQDNYPNAGLSIYDIANNTWTTSKWNDPSSPAAVNTSQDAEKQIWGAWREEYMDSGTPLSQLDGLTGISQHGFAYDIDNDGTQEVFVIGGRCFQFGGIGLSNPWMSKYDPDTNEWSFTATPTFTWKEAATYPMCGGPAYTPNYGVAIQNGSDVYYVTGDFWGFPGKDPNDGWAEKTTVGRACAVYSITTNSWTALDPIPVTAGTKITNAVGCMLNGKLYIAGGLYKDPTGVNTVSDNIWEYDLTASTPAWNLVGHLNQATCYSSCVAYQGKMYIIGGNYTEWSWDCTNVIQVFNPADYSCSEFGQMERQFCRGSAALIGSNLYIGDAIGYPCYADAWHKTDLSVTPLTWSYPPTDPSGFPYQDWVENWGLVGKVTDSVTGNPVPRVMINIGDEITHYRYLSDDAGEFAIKVPESLRGKSKLLVTFDAWGYANYDELISNPGEYHTMNVELTPNAETCFGLVNANMEQVNTETNTPESWSFWANNEANTWSSASFNHEPGGSHCAEVVHPGFSGSRLSQQFTLPVGSQGKYLNLNVWRNANGSGYLGEELRFFDSADNLIKLRGNDVGWVWGDGGTWSELDVNRFVYRVRIPENAVSMKVQFQNDWNGTLRIDDVRVELVDAAVGTVTGKVMGANGPVQGLYVFCKPAAYAGMDCGRDSVTTTDSEGNFTIDLPLGEYNICIWGEGYNPTADIFVLVDGNKSLGDIVVEKAAPNLIAGRSDSIIVSSEMMDETKDRVVDGDLWSGWKSQSESWDMDYLIATFQDPSEIKDIVLWRGTDTLRLDPQFASYAIDVMISGTPSDPASWDDPNNYQTIYSKDHSFLGYEVLQGLGVCVMPVNIADALGVRVRIWDKQYYWHPQGQIGELQIHGNGLFALYDKIGDLQKLPTDTKVSIPGKQMTASPNLAGVPAGVAFIEESDRSSGIRLDVSGVDPVEMANFYVNYIDGTASFASVDGTIRAGDGGYKYIEVARIRNTGDCYDLVDPLGMNNRFAACKLAEGLYVKVWGIADYIGIVDGKAVYTFDDGSGSPIKLINDPGAPTLTGGTLIRVKGVLTKDLEGTVLYMTDMFEEQ